MTSELKNQMPLVYFVCEGSSRLFNHAEMLRNEGYRVHCFESHLAALECSEEAKFPDIFVTTPFLTTIDTWQFIYLIRELAAGRHLQIPVLILAKATVDIPTMAMSTGLTSLNFLAYPIDKKTMMDRVAQLLEQDRNPVEKTILVHAENDLFPDMHQQILEASHFRIVKIEDLYRLTDKDVPYYRHMFLLGATKFDKKLKQNLHVVSQRFPDLPIIVMAQNVSIKQTMELVSMGVSSVVPAPCSAGTLCKYCHNASLQFLFRRWEKYASLREKEFEDNEQLYRKVVESQNDLMCKWLPDTTLTYVNNTFCQMLRSSRKNLVGKPISQVIIPDSKTSIEVLTREIMETGQTQAFEHGYIDKQGHTRWHHWTCSPVFSADNIPTEILAVGRDISDLKTLEMNLARNNAELESLITTIPNQFWYLSDPDTYRSANQTHADFLGKSITSLTDCPLTTIYSPDDVKPWRAITMEVIEKRQTVSAERMLTSRSGHRCLLAVTETPCFDENGTIRFVVCSARDVTEERMNEFNLAYKAEFEHLISRISSEFVQVDASVSERVITGSLEKIVHFTGIDRAYICLDEDRDFTGIPQFAWTTETAFPLARGIHREHEWFMKILKELKPVCIANTSAFPPDAGKEEEYCRINQIKSLLIVPIEQNRKLVGYIVLEAIHTTINWEPEIQSLLKFYGEIFFTTLQKTRAWNFIESERDFGIAVNMAQSLDDLLTICLDYLIAIADMDSGGIYIVNDADNSLELVEHKNLSQDFIETNHSFQTVTSQYSIVSDGQPMYVDQEKMMTPSRKYLAEEGLTTYGVFPITFENRIVACVNLGSRTRKRMSDLAKAAVETVVSRLGSLITKVKMEDAIRRNWNNLDTLFNSMKDYLFAVDDQGIIRHANKACQNNLGYTPADLLQMRIDEFYPEDYKDEITALMKTETDMSVAGGATQLVRADGSRLPVDIRLVRGEWLGAPVWFVFNHDVEELKEAEKRRILLERQVQQAQKVESLSRMAGAIAHRFNNLLMGIIGNLELIRMQVDPESRILDKLNQAESAAQRATDLGRLMLTYVGQVGTNRVHCDLTDVTRRLMPLLTASAPSCVKFEMEFTENLPMISADVGGLHQIIMNLASNSWESFGADGGRIHLETGLHEITDDFDEPLVENEMLRPGDYVYFAITDNGSGMDKETVDRMFDPFFSTKFTGRGLGLSTVLGIVRAHEGAISVISEKGISTRVTLWFPALKEKRVALQSVFGQEMPEGFVNKVILLADDEDDVREVALQMLEKLGYSVIPVSDGEKAVTVFESNPSIIDYVICDVKMPGRDGWDVMDSIRRIRSDVPVILVTGFGVTDSEMQHRSKPDGMIQKPYRFQNLIKVLNKD